MRRNVLTIICAIAITLFVGYNVYNSYKTNDLSDIALANVEALAQGEWGEYPNIWYQECSICYTVYHNTGAFFFCNVGIDNCFDTDCVAGYCF